jgi:Transposase DDE domain group 1
VTIDLDATHCETYGLHKQGASKVGRDGARGYHPLLASVAGSGDVQHSRLRGGMANSGRGAASFITETINRARRAGATRPITLRGDSGFYNHKVVNACYQQGVRCSITVRLDQAVNNVIAQIPDDAWTPIPYWLDDGADVAETRYGPLAEGPSHAADRAARTAHPRQPARLVLRLGLPRVRYRPRRADLGAGGRPPPPRRGRKRDP